MGVTEVPSRSNDVLDFSEVDHFAYNIIDHGAEFATEAVREVSHTHVRATDGEHVTDLHFIICELASLRDVTGEEGTLGEPSDVEFTTEEGLVSVKSGTCLVGLSLEV